MRGQEGAAHSRFVPEVVVSRVFTVYLRMFTAHVSDLQNTTQLVSLHLPCLGQVWSHLGACKCVIESSYDIFRPDLDMKSQCVGGKVSCRLTLNYVIMLVLDLVSCRALSGCRGSGLGLSGCRAVGACRGMPGYVGHVKAVGLSMWTSMCVLCSL